MADQFGVSGEDLRLVLHGALLFVAGQRGDAEVTAEYLDSLVDMGGVPELVLACMRISSYMKGLEGS